MLVVSFPAGSSLSQPLYILHVSTAAADTTHSNGGGAALNASTARLLVNLAAGASVEVVEEYVSATADGAHVSMPVAEVVLAENAVLKHGYVNREAQGASHFKATLVTQVCMDNSSRTAALFSHFFCHFAYQGHHVVSWAMCFAGHVPCCWGGCVPVALICPQHCAALGSVELAGPPASFEAVHRPQSIQL